MHVADFQACTFNLESNLSLFLEDNQQLLPLSFLHLSDSAVSLSVGEPPLTLAELDYGLQFCQPALLLTIEHDGKTKPVFGFRRVDQQLYLH